MPPGRQEWPLLGHHLLAQGPTAKLRIPNEGNLCHLRETGLAVCLCGPGLSGGTRYLDAQYQTSQTEPPEAPRVVNRPPGVKGTITWPSPLQHPIALHKLPSLD